MVIIQAYSTKKNRNLPKIYHEQIITVITLVYIPPKLYIIPDTCRGKLCVHVLNKGDQLTQFGISLKKSSVPQNKNDNNKALNPSLEYKRNVMSQPVFNLIYCKC